MLGDHTIEFLCGASAVVVGAGVWMIIRAMRAKSAMDDQLDLPDEERSYFGRQYRRRILTSSLLVILGAIIAPGYFYFSQNAPFVREQVIVFLMVVFTLLAALFAFSILELREISQRKKQAFRSLHEKKTRLAEELAQFRQSKVGRRP